MNQPLHGPFLIDRPSLLFFFFHDRAPSSAFRSVYPPSGSHKIIEICVNTTQRLKYASLLNSSEPVFAGFGRFVSVRPRFAKFSLMHICFASERVVSTYRLPLERHAAENGSIALRYEAQTTLFPQLTLWALSMASLTDCLDVVSRREGRSSPEEDI